MTPEHRAHIADLIAEVRQIEGDENTPMPDPIRVLHIASVLADEVERLDQTQLTTHLRRIIAQYELQASIIMSAVEDAVEWSTGS